MQSTKLSTHVTYDPNADQSAAVQAALDLLPDGNELSITSPVRCSVILRGKGKTLRTAGAGIIIGAAPLDRLVGGQAFGKVNVLAEGEGLTISCAIAATGGGAVGFRACTNSQLLNSRLTINQHEPGIAMGMAMALGGDNVHCAGNTIEADLSDAEFGGIRWGNSNPAEQLPNGDIIGNTISKCGHSPIVMHSGGQCSGNWIDATGGTHGSAIAIAAEYPWRRWIHNNYILGAASHGIASDSIAGRWTCDVLVEDNDIEGSAECGIYVARAMDWIVRGNRVYRNGRKTQNGCRGILVTAESGSIVIADNDLGGQPGGIHVIASGKEHINNVGIYGNRVHSVSSIAPFAVRGMNGATVSAVTSMGNRWMATDKDGNSAWIDGKVVGLVERRDEMAGKVYRNVTA